MLIFAQPETVRLYEHLSCHWQPEVGLWMNFFHARRIDPLRSLASLQDAPDGLRIPHA